jgi:hypothetical protein
MIGDLTLSFNCTDILLPEEAGFYTKIYKVIQVGKY